MNQPAQLQPNPNQLAAQMWGKPVDPLIYLEATCLQGPWPEAHLVKFDYLISYLARGSNSSIANSCLIVG